MTKTKSILIIVMVFLTGIISLQGQENPLQIKIKKIVEDLQPEAVSIRRQLHQIPEPCFKEDQTSKFVAQYLRKCGLEVQTGIGGTGLKAILRGQKASPVLGIRSDMDALPIEENTGLPFQSTHKGFMHACGHDAHMTNVLITAKTLSMMKDQLPGTIVFVFQPCEEGAPDGGPSGADIMVEEGLLDNPKIDAMIGLHVMPGKVGEVQLRKGPFMANVANIFIDIKGKSSHGALPQQGIDAIYAAATAIQQFQMLISRRRDPNERAVLSIGKLEGGVRANVIAEKVHMEGTVRTFSFETQDMIEKGMKDILEGLKVSMGIDYGYKFNRVTQFVKNDDALTGKMNQLFNRLLGQSNVHVIEPMTIGEDFSVYSHLVPSFFFFLNVGENKSLHTPNFSVDEEALKYGPFLLSAAAFEYFEQLRI